jgi:hypothetical protein
MMDPGPFENVLGVLSRAENVEALRKLDEG